MKRIRIVIAEGELLVQEGIASLVMNEADMECVAQIGDSEEFIKLIRKLTPDVIIVGASMQKTDTVQAVRDAKACTNSVILVILDSKHRYTVDVLMEAGVDGLVSRNTSSHELMNIIRVLYAGHSVLGKDTRKNQLLVNVVEDDNNNGFELMHDRELQVLRLAAIGMSNKEIGQRLILSKHTVATHLYNTYRKLGVASRVEAISLGMKTGLLDINVINNK